MSPVYFQVSSSTLLDPHRLDTPACIASSLTGGMCGRVALLGHACVCDHVFCKACYYGIHACVVVWPYLGMHACAIMCFARACYYGIHACVDMRLYLGMHVIIVMHLTTM